MAYIFLAVFSALLLVIVYFYTREKRVTVIDSFFFFFLLQYGPHTLFINRYSQFALEMSPATESRYLLGMTVAYLSLAVSLVAASFLIRTPPESYVPSTNSDSRVFFGVAVAVVYVLVFVVLQGRDLPITREYLRGFSGTSVFDYTELRREIYNDSIYVRIASLTRQTTTAVLFSWLIGMIFPLRWVSAMAFGAATTVFMVCAMQMNKFPFVYFLVLSAITIASKGTKPWQAEKSGRKTWLLTASGIVSVLLLYGLYRVQYSAVSAVTEDRLNKVLVYRIFFCASDSLRLWFDYFPAGHSYLGLSGIPVFAEALGLPVYSPTRMIPQEYISGVDTTAQTGFIGSGYAMGGFPGLIGYSLFIGFLVTILSRMQVADRGRADVMPFWNVLMINMLFLTTRELHTAMLSGGTVSVLVLLAVFRRFPRVSL